MFRLYTVYTVQCTFDNNPLFVTNGQTFSNHVCKLGYVLLLFQNIPLPLILLLVRIDNNGPISIRKKVIKNQGWAPRFFPFRTFRSFPLF